MFVAVLKGYLEDKPNYSDIDLAYHLRLKQAQSEGTGYQPDRSISRPQQHSAGIRRDLAAVKGSDYRAALDACKAEQIRATLCLHRDSPDPETNRCRNTIFSESRPRCTYPYEKSGLALLPSRYALPDDAIWRRTPRHPGLTRRNRDLSDNSSRESD